MITFDIRKLFPRFILEDRNGYAMAKAIEAGLNAFLGVCQTGINCLQNVDEMPEWRLDEMAWEYNIPYDNAAGIDTKREWIRNAHTLNGMLGSKTGVENYLSSYLGPTTMEEFWEYGGSWPNFRLKTTSDWNQDILTWVLNTLPKIKSILCELDGFTFEGTWPHNLFVGCALYTYESGTYSLPAVEMEDDWYTDENGDMLLDENGILMIVEEATT